MVHTEATKQHLRSIRAGEKNPFFGKKHLPEAKGKMSKWTKDRNAKRQYEIRKLSIKIPTTTDLYYLAGIIDGEGSIKFKKGRPFIAVYNTNKLLMAWLIHTIGGTYRDADKRGRKVCYTWTISATRDVYALCIALWEALIIKQDDADEVINHLKNKYGQIL